MNIRKLTKHILPVILALICIFFFTFDSFVSGISYEHDCSGCCCLLCQLFSVNYGPSYSVRVAYTVAALLAALFTAIFIVLKNEAHSIILKTPVFLKVKLSN